MTGQPLSYPSAGAGGRKGVGAHSLARKYAVSGHKAHDPEAPDQAVSYLFGRQERRGEIGVYEWVYEYGQTTRTESPYSYTRIS
jgi:hypothetical protein